MTGTPEVPLPTPDVSGVQGSTPQEVTQIPERPEVSASMYESGVSASGSGATPPVPVVTDPVVPAPQPVQTKVKTLTVPKSQQELLELAKGEPDKALTWLAKFWIRRIKQSVKNGWHLIMPQPLIPTAPQSISGVQMTQPLVQPTQQMQPVQTTVQPNDPQGQQQTQSNTVQQPV